MLELINAVTSNYAVPFAVVTSRPVAAAVVAVAVTVTVASAQLSRLSQRVVTSKVNFCWVAWCGCRAVAQGCF
ncbi:hypothetical protein, partial [Actinoplanes rectilineatus]|uniref:hypothetical protein n=1 Tax=Actinoplanes rectilineatus TaxID=113571 RepID=UPI001B80517A